jgi:predicted  nucleic acid-binding Zn-ribbon protein
MKDDLVRIEAKIDGIQKDISHIKITSTEMRGHIERNTEDVAEHIKRTNQLEDKVLDLLKEEYAQKKFIKWAGGIIGVVTSVAGAAWAISRFFF